MRGVHRPPRINPHSAARISSRQVWSPSMSHRDRIDTYVDLDTPVYRPFNTCVAVPSPSDDSLQKNEQKWLWKEEVGKRRGREKRGRERRKKKKEGKERWLRGQCAHVEERDAPLTGWLWKGLVTTIIIAVATSKAPMTHPTVGLSPLVKKRRKDPGAPASK